MSGNNELSRAEKEWGIKIESIRLASAGMMLDFRYRVTDPDKAAPLLKRQVKSYLVQEGTGHKFYVPTTPKAGSLRQKTREPEKGKVYFTLFANPGRIIQPGDKVRVVIDDFESGPLTVQ